MRELLLDDLPKHSPWPARLLGLDDRDGEGYGGTGVEWYDDAYGHLLASLRDAEAFDVTRTAYDVVGGNPLHPLSEVHWRPA